MFCLESCCEMMQLMAAELMLDLPWVDASKTTFEGLDVRRGRISKLQFDDGIVLDVQVVDPGSYRDGGRSPARRVSALWTFPGSLRSRGHAST